MGLLSSLVIHKMLGLVLSGVIVRNALPEHEHAIVTVDASRKSLLENVLSFTRVLLSVSISLCTTLAIRPPEVVIDAVGFFPTCRDARAALKEKAGRRKASRLVTHPFSETKP